KLNYAPRASSSPAPSAAAPPSVAASGTAPAAPPATAPPATAPPPQPATPPPPPPAPAAAQPPAPGAPARVTFTPPNAEGQLGAAITVSLNVENAADLFTVPMVISFDKSIVRLNDITPG